MRHIIPAAFALTMAVGGVAMAQDRPDATRIAPAPATTATTNPATGARRRLGSTPGALGTNGAKTMPRSATRQCGRTRTHPVPGANSFTEGEARSRIQDKGFGQVTNLKLDDQGVWRGTATKDGKTTKSPSTTRATSSRSNRVDVT